MRGPLWIFTAATLPFWACLSAPSFAKPFDLHEFKIAIEKTHASTLEKAAALLASQLKRNFTAVYKSDSAQSASPEHPRIIFWDEKAGFAASIAGETGQPESNAIEMWQFDSQKNKFNFVRQEFPLSIDKNNKPIFAPTAEVSCLACHGNDPRPIWGEYPTWNGVFGSINDFIQKSETPLLKNFRASAQDRTFDGGRYHDLFKANLAPESPYPYRDESKAMAATRASAQNRPNMRLNFMVSRLNTKRVMRMIRQSPNYQNNIPLLLYGFLGCDNNGQQKTPDALLNLAGVSLLDLDLRVPDTEKSLLGIADRSSYFDGSASMNEFIANEIFLDAKSSDPELFKFYRPSSLQEKFPHGKPINDLDFAFNSSTDRFGKWIPTPFPDDDIDKKHRRALNEDQMENWFHACVYLGSRLTPEKISSIATKTLPSLSKVTSAAHDGTSPHGSYPYFQKYCAECHADKSAGGVSIKNETDLALYLKENRNRMIDKIESDKMPRGRSNWSEGDLNQWNRDRPLLLKELEASASLPVESHHQ